MYYITILDAQAMILILALVFWPPFILMLPFTKAQHTYFDLVKKSTWLMFMYPIEEVILFVYHALFATGLIMLSVVNEDPLNTNPILISLFLIGFVRITLCHVVRSLVYRYQGPIRALIMQILVMLMTVVLVILSGIIYAWFTFGFMIAVMLFDILYVASYANWTFVRHRIEKSYTGLMKAK